MVNIMTSRQAQLSRKIATKEILVTRVCILINANLQANHTILDLPDTTRIDASFSRKKISLCYKNF